MGYFLRNKPLNMTSWEEIYFLYSLESKERKICPLAVFHKTNDVGEYVNNCLNHRAMYLFGTLLAI